jgi:4-hydroxy-3-methylbut-2-enyl diphosphate reductase
MNTRFETLQKEMNTRFEAIQKEMNARFEAVNARFEAIEKRFTTLQWTIGIGFTAIFLISDTICRQVSNREPQLDQFARKFDVIIFIAGKKSSNGKVLYEVCRNANPKSYFISSVEEIQKEWFEEAHTVGICGATSTPMWQMEQAKQWIENQFSLISV